MCPACKSEISGDGSTLHAMSKYLEELIETAGDVEKLEKVIESLEAKLQAAKQEKAKAEVVAKTKPEETKHEPVQQKAAKPSGGGNWW